MNYDNVDADFTWDGDYTIGQDGDLGDTADDYIRSLINEIRDLVKSDFGDWSKDPSFAGDLTDFNGEPNTRETGKRIEDRIKSRITAVQLVNAQDLFVKVTPVHVNQVLITIRVQAVATSKNSLKVGEPVVLALVYDSTEHSIFFLPPVQTNKAKIFR
jgi:hypothetical protein